MRICENTSNLFKISLQLESTNWIFWKHLGFMIHTSFANLDMFCRAQIKPLKVRIWDPQNYTNPWIRETNSRVHHSLIWFLQPYQFSKSSQILSTIHNLNPPFWIFESESMDSTYIVTTNSEHQNNLVDPQTRICKSNSYKKGWLIIFVQYLQSIY